MAGTAVQTSTPFFGIIGVSPEQDAKQEQELEGRRLEQALGTHSHGGAWGNPTVAGGSRSRALYCVLTRRTDS